MMTQICSRESTQSNLHSTEICVGLRDTLSGTDLLHTSYNPIYPYFTKVLLVYVLGKFSELFFWIQYLSPTVSTVFACKSPLEKSLSSNLVNVRDETLGWIPLGGNPRADFLTILAIIVAGAIL